ncbi:MULTISPECIES: DUF6292 family protein [Actinokineospora]|uniref:DUF6292 domain-containing protein n=1 Tax=Actinokineospora fastidiosa TaxID=1816 RepID=A0A918LFP7_9PSEU|nr:MULTISPECIES: DUF6292 family protein [Actinokineospora]UVS77580.1 hypothetical protein Actkin_01295 [Actinokineospora sp. UTMC 2448]GGS42397.1 hypothetical protein GCM10010171_41560 [Actinokineospora fastidiosa]
MTQTAQASAHAHALAQALADYVRAVADTVGVPADGVNWEVTDTVTAYVALNCRSAGHPGRDVMLAWEESQGWVVSVETAPAEAPIVLSRMGGDSVPAPEAVARFVAESLGKAAGDAEAGPGAIPAARTDRGDLAARLHRRTR